LAINFCEKYSPKEVQWRSFERKWSKSFVNISHMARGISMKSAPWSWQFGKKINSIHFTCQKGDGEATKKFAR
jgi:hypothetical protein